MSLLSGLVAHWRLDESGGVRSDAHSSHNLSEYGGTVLSSTGKIGSSALFVTLDSQRLQRTPVDSDLQLGAGDFTVAFWARAASEFYGELLGWVDPFFIVYTELDGTLAVQCGSDYFTFQSFTLSQWHLVVLSYDNANSRLYCYLDNSGPVIQPMAVTGGSTEFNVGGYYTNYGTRRVDSLSIWQRFITGAERDALWNGGYGLDYPFSSGIEVDLAAVGSSSVTAGLHVTKPLSVAPVGQCNAFASASLVKVASATASGASVSVMVPSLTKSLAASTAGSSADSATITGVVSLATAASAGRSVVVTPLSITKPLSVSSAGKSTVSTIPSFTRTLVAQSDGRSVSVMVPTVTVPVDCASAGESAVGADLYVSTTEILDAVFTGRSSVAMELSGTRTFELTAAGVSLVMATVTQEIAIEADSANGASVVDASISQVVPLSCGSTWNSAVTADLVTDHDVTSAASAGLSVVEASLTDDVTLSVVADGASVVSCDLTVREEGEATSTGSSAVTIGLTVDVAISGSVSAGSSAVAASLEVGRILSAASAGSSAVIIAMGGLHELTATTVGRSVVSVLFPVEDQPYWFGNQALGFTRAVEVVVGSLAYPEPTEPGARQLAGADLVEAHPAEEAGQITARPMINLARAVNDRLRSGLGDCAWRIVYYVLGLFREMRNPSADGYHRPGLAEFFESYQPLLPDAGDWPTNGPGDPEGANVNSPLGGYLFGNESVDLDSEAAMLDAIPTTMPDGTAPQTMADHWAIKKRQMGAVDPVTGAQVAPAIEAARHWGSVRYSRSSWHLTSYGGWLPTPDLLETDCDDPDEFDGIPAPPNYEIKFAATEAGLAAGYADRTYAGTCRVGPAISPANKYDDHVSAVVDTPWTYYVVLNGGTVEALPRWAYVEGPYYGPPRLRKTTGDQLARALARAAAGWRGDRQDATARSAMDAGAVDRPRDWLVGAFDAQAFLGRQYALAPALGRAVEGGVEGLYPGWRWDAASGNPAATAGTVVPPVGAEDAHTVAPGAVVRHLFLEASGLSGAARVTIEVDGERVVAVSLSTEMPGDIVALPVDVQAGSTIRLRFEAAATFAPGGYVRAEAAQQLDYRPDLSDLIAVLRRSGPDIEGHEYALGAEVSAQLDRYGLIAPPFSGEAPQYPTQYSGHPVYEAARRWSQSVRIIPRRQLVGYAVEDGRSVLWFRRRAVGMGGPVYRVEVLQGSGGILPGQEYAVDGAPGDQVQYPQSGGPIIEPGGHFVGTADDNDFLTNGTPRVYAVSSGILDQAVGADLFTGIAEQIAHEAPPGGFTNEWLLGCQLKPYHTSQSSIWKPESFSDRFPINDRCTFYSPEIVNEYDGSKLWHAAYGLGIEGLYGGNLIAEWPTGWRYAPLTSAWSGREHLNQITVDGVRWPDNEARNRFYRSARIYEPDVDVLSCEAVTEGVEELVKVTLTGRLHNTHGQTGGAPRDIPREMSEWDANAVENEPFRTSENAVRAYLLHSSTGRNFGAIIGDNAANSYVQDLTDNPFASIFPHIYMVRLVPEPYEDGNEDQDETDTPLYHDPLALVDLYIRAICEGFVDHQQSTAKLLQWVEDHDGELPESWGLHDYSHPELCRQAHESSWTGIVITEDRDDMPHGFGPWPATEVTAEVFNRLVRQVNLLNKVRLMIPYTYEVRQDGYFDQRVRKPEIEISMTGNVSTWVDNAQWPGAGTPDPGNTTDWAEANTALSLATGGLGALDVSGTVYVTEANASVTSEWRVSLADGIEHAFPPFVRDLYDAQDVAAIVWYERERRNHTRAAVPYAESEPVDGNLGWYTSGGEYYAWQVGPIDQADAWAAIATEGRVVADAPPPSDAGLGRSAGMPSETFEADGGGQSSLQAYFMPGSTLCLTVPLVD